MGLRGRHAKAVIKRRRHLQLRADQPVGEIKIRRRLLLGDRLRVQRLPLRLAIGKLRAGDIRREANNLPQGFTVAIEIGIRPALGAGQTIEVILQRRALLRILQGIIGCRQEGVARQQTFAADQDLPLGGLHQLRGVRLPGRPGINRTVEQRHFGVHRTEKHPLHILWRNSRLLQRFQRHKVANRSFTGSDAFAF